MATSELLVEVGIDLQYHLTIIVPTELLAEGEIAVSDQIVPVITDSCNRGGGLVMVSWSDSKNESSNEAKYFFGTGTRMRSTIGGETVSHLKTR